MTGTNGPNPRRRRSPRPYRDSALLYGALGVIVVVTAVLTGGRVLWAIVAAVGAFLIATGWSWRSIRMREARRRQ
jgi:uncharacterized membrane protein HdeD (DUF308 family)